MKIDWVYAIKFAALLAVAVLLIRAIVEVAVK